MSLVNAYLIDGCIEEHKNSISQGVSEIVYFCKMFYIANSILKPFRRSAEEKFNWHLRISVKTT